MSGLILFLLTILVSFYATNLTQANTPTSSCDTNEAVQYLMLIEAMNWEAMHARLAKDARYLDPTMTHYDRPAIDLTGPEAIVEFWRTSSEESGTHSISYDYRHCFETAGFYVVRYEIAVEVSGEFWGLKQDRVTIPGQVTSVIQIAGGKIVEHRDYVDYAAAERYIEELREQ